MNKKFFVLLAILLLPFTNLFAQDKVVLKDSTILNVKVTASNDKSISYTYPNEDVVNEKAKKDIAYIIYASGRKEECSKTPSIPIIRGKEDYEKVIITHDKEDVIGLKKTEQIAVSAGNGGVFNSATKAYNSAIIKLKKKAAQLKCGIVLITSETFGGQYNNISNISGEAYK